MGLVVSGDRQCSALFSGSPDPSFLRTEFLKEWFRGISVGADDVDWETMYLALTTPPNGVKAARLMRLKHINDPKKKRRLHDNFFCNIDRNDDDRVTLDELLAWVESKKKPTAEEVKGLRFDEESDDRKAVEYGLRADFDRMCLPARRKRRVEQPTWTGDGLGLEAKRPSSQPQVQQVTPQADEDHPIGKRQVLSEQEFHKALRRLDEEALIFAEKIGLTQEEREHQDDMNKFCKGAVYEGRVTRRQFYRWGMYKIHKLQQKTALPAMEGVDDYVKGEYISHGRSYHYNDDETKSADIPREVYAGLKDLFRKADANNDKLLDEKELYTACEKWPNQCKNLLGLKLYDDVRKSADEIQAAVAQHAVYKNKKLGRALNIGEFMHWGVQHHLKKNASSILFKDFANIEYEPTQVGRKWEKKHLIPPIQVLNRMKDIFKRADMNSDGLIEKQELGRALKKDPSLCKDLFTNGQADVERLFAEDVYLQHAKALTFGQFLEWAVVKQAEIAQLNEDKRFEDAGADSASAAGMGLESAQKQDADSQGQGQQQQQQASSSLETKTDVGSPSKESKRGSVTSPLQQPVADPSSARPSPMIRAASTEKPLPSSSQVLGTPSRQGQGQGHTRSESGVGLGLGLGLGLTATSSTASTASTATAVLDGATTAAASSAGAGSSSGATTATNTTADQDTNSVNTANNSHNDNPSVATSNSAAASPEKPLLQVPQTPSSQTAIPSPPPMG